MICTTKCNSQRQGTAIRIGIVLIRIPCQTTKGTLMNWYVTRGLTTPRRVGYSRTPIRYGAQSVLGYLTVTEVARRMNKTKQHIRYLIRKGTLPASKIADMWLIKTNDLPRETWSV